MKKVCLSYVNLECVLRDTFIESFVFEVHTIIEVEERWETTRLVS